MYERTIRLLMIVDLPPALGCCLCLRVGQKPFPRQTLVPTFMPALPSISQQIAVTVKMFLSGVVRIGEQATAEAKRAPGRGPQGVAAME